MVGIGIRGRVVSRIVVGQGPFQLRRNGQALREGPESPQKLRAFLAWDREPDLQPSTAGNQVGPTRNTKSRTARNRRSNQQRGKTVSRKPARRL